MQQRDPGLGQRDTRGVEKLAGLAVGKAQISRADLGQLAGQAQLVQAQPHIVTRGHYRVHVRGKVGQQPGELSGGFWRGQLVEIIHNQRDAAVSVGELREHPVDHRRCVEVRRPCRRFRAAVCTGGVTDRAEQGQPELLGVVLAALHLHEGEPARLPGRQAQTRSSDVFPLPAGAEMTVTFLAAARSRAATRSPRSISRGAARATVKLAF